MNAERTESVGPYPANRLKELRIARGLSQPKLAEIVSPKTSPQMIGMLENRQRQLTQGWMERLAKALECRPGDLLPEEDQAEADFQESIEGLGEPPGFSESDGASGGVVRVPREGRIQAGLFAAANELLPEDRGVTVIPADTPFAHLPLRSARIFGPSMDEFYPEGSDVVYVPAVYLGNGWMPKPGQHVIVQRRSEWGETELTVKEIRYGPGDDPEYLELWPRSSKAEFQKPWRFPIKRDEDAGPQDTMFIAGLVLLSVKQAPGV